MKYLLLLLSLNAYSQDCHTLSVHHTISKLYDESLIIENQLENIVIKEMARIEASVIDDKYLPKYLKDWLDE